MVRLSDLLQQSIPQTLGITDVLNQRQREIFDLHKYEVITVCPVHNVIHDFDCENQAVYDCADEKAVPLEVETYDPTTHILKERNGKPRRYKDLWAMPTKQLKAALANRVPCGKEV